jgi:hypothetical protein
MKIKFAISSNINYYKITIDKIIPSLLRSGIPASDIYMFAGGAQEYKFLTNQYNINFYEADHNSIDLTGLISIIDLNLQSDYWFLLHDTCFAGDNFYKNILNFKYDSSIDAIRGVGQGTSMNIGAYSNKYLYSVKNLLEHNKNKNYLKENLQKIKLKGVSFENLLLDVQKLNWYTKVNNVFINQEIEKIKILNYSNKYLWADSGQKIDFYENQTARIKCYFEDIDLYKYAANYSDPSTVKEWILKP